MASPAHELVGVAVARLRNVAAVTDLVGDRVAYRRPDGASFPQIAGVYTDSQRDDASCVTGASITLEVHAWARDGGVDPLQDVRAIAHAVAEALHGYPLNLPTNELVTLDHVGERVFYDADGLTGHGVIEFRAITQST